MGTVSPETSSEIKNHLKKFDAVTGNEAHCTHCYNAKTIAMQNHVKSLGTDVYVLGHHKTDAVVSLVKCFWIEQYYEHFTKPSEIPYQRRRMTNFIAKSKLNLDYLEEMVSQKRATTDEPPVEIKNGIKLVRPLAEITEPEIVEFIGTYPREKQNCTYDKGDTISFRTIVGTDLKKRIIKTPDIVNTLYTLVSKGLKTDGTLKFRPRNHRDHWYPGFKPFIVKA